MLRASLTAYPWDLIDEGVDVVLDRLHGEIGLTGLSLWVGSPSVQQLRSRRVEPRVFFTRGGLFFQPSDAHYIATRCKPIMSSWLAGRDPLAIIAEACADRKIDLRAIVSASLPGRLARRHTDAACKNVFGVASQASICLANPDVQGYLCGLAADLSSNFDIGGVALADFSLTWHEALRCDLRTGVPLGDTERALLGVCFCDSCHRASSVAGVDVDSAARSTRKIIEKCLKHGAAADTTLGDVLADDEPLADAGPLAAYFHWRADALSELLRRIKDACRRELLLIRNHPPPASERWDGPDPGVPDAVVTYIDHPNQLQTALVSGARRSELGTPESWAVGPKAPQLVSALSEAARLGFTGLDAGNYGFLPDAAFTAIKQAIRFAKRTGDA